MTEKRQAELRAAAVQLAPYLAETQDGRDLQAATDAIAGETFASLDAAERAAGMTSLTTTEPPEK